MKVLTLHSQYRDLGGEDFVFTQETLLHNPQKKIFKWTLKNRYGILGGIQFLISIWNILEAHKLKKLIHNFQPDIIHIHNWHFASGPIIIRTATKKQIPVVLTLHNYRLLCPSATLLKDGNLFTNSLQSKFPWQAVWKRVYRNSFLQTFWLAFIVWFHKLVGTWRMVDRYIVLTDFARSQFVNSTLGVSDVKFVIKPNFVTDPPKFTQVRDESFLFIGRLSNEKGIETLLQAFKKTGLTLRIAGGGPLEALVLATCQEVSTIHYLGPLDKTAINQELGKATALVFPSIWYEGMPMTILESFASCTPVIASNLGAMATMIQPGYNGLHFEAGNVQALAQVLDFWHNMSETEKNTYRLNARSTYEAHYTPDENRKQLLAIYQQVINEKKTA
jgi:glycosyltransferase involved in cell wall biosynthesis